MNSTHDARKILVHPMDTVNPIGMLSSFDNKLNEFYKSGAKDSTLENLIKDCHLIPPAEKILEKYESDISKLIFKSKKKLDVDTNITLSTLGNTISVICGTATGFLGAIYAYGGMNPDASSGVITAYGLAGLILGSALETRFKLGAKAMLRTYVNFKTLTTRTPRNEYKNKAVVEMDELKLTTSEDY